MSKKLKNALLLSTYILGYTSLSFELIILRQLINFVGSNTLITSIIMAFILMFLSLGYYLGSVISFSKYPIRKIVSGIICGLSVWYILACSFPVIGAFFHIFVFSGIKSAAFQVTVLSFVLLTLPSVALGFITSVLGRIIHHFDANYTGRFMAVDTVGSVSGSLLTTLVFMPFFGIYAATTVLVFLTSSVLWLLSRDKRKISVFFVLYITIISIVVSNEKILFNEKTLIQDDAISRIEIFDEDFVDGKYLSKVMSVNGSGSSKVSSDEALFFEYIKYVNDVFIDNLPTDKVSNILVLGAGGFIVGKEDRRNQYVFLDVIHNLKEISEEYFLKEKLTDNKKFIAQDAYQYMIRDKNKYDLIFVDVYSSPREIPLNFVTVDFFNMVKEHLAQDGIMIANIITSPSFKSKYALRLDNTLRYVFPHYLSRQVINSKKKYDPYSKEVRNIIYTYYNYPSDNTIYTVDKNAAVFGQ